MWGWASIAKTQVVNSAPFKDWNDYFKPMDQSLDSEYIQDPPLTLLPPYYAIHSGLHIADALQHPVPFELNPSCNPFVLFTRQLILHCPNAHCPPLIIGVRNIQIFFNINMSEYVHYWYLQFLRSCYSFVVQWTLSFTQDTQDKELLHLNQRSMLSLCGINSSMPTRRCIPHTMCFKCSWKSSKHSTRPACLNPKPDPE